MSNPATAVSPTLPVPGVDASGNRPAFDFLVIGSGFGGSVSALRLVDKGYRVLLCEKGRAFAASDFPRTNWQLSRWLWLPLLRWRGFFQMSFFRHVTVLSGVGLGGGSLVYANTLPIPPSAFFDDPRWSGLAAWYAELQPHYATVRRMLGASVTPILGPADQLLREVVRRRGEDEKFQATTTAIYYGEAGKTVEDPYFGGEGPPRTGCIACGACMTGCRHGAKNSLDRNYLYLAQKRGLAVRSGCEVVHVAPAPNGDGYLVRLREWSHGWWQRNRESQIWVKSVVFAAGVLGTMELLTRLQRDPLGLPKLSMTLGHGVSTNSESLIGVTSGQKGVDFSKGVAIGSMYQVDDQSHAEMVRYGGGSGAFRLLAAPHVARDVIGPLKALMALWWLLRHPWRSLRALTVRDWARSTMILLYMRVAQEPLRLRWSPWRRWLGIGPGIKTHASGQPPTSTLPAASKLADELARASQGVAVSLLTETTLGIPTTAHILGGACMGIDANHGVIDHQHRVFGYPGLYVIDGSAISANPGVNPSLTIAALAERAMTFIPAKHSLEGAGASADES